MGRIRTIKPEFHSHEDLSLLPAETHLFAAALLNYADDEGYFNANPVLLKAGTTPLRNDQTRLEEQVQQLERIGYISIRRDGTKSIGWVVNFTSHQRVSHPTLSKLKPKFEEIAPDQNFVSDSGAPREPLRPEGKGKERNREQGKEQSAPEARVEFEIPAWIDPAAFNRFLAMRKKLRKTPTPEAVALLVKKLEALKRAGHDPTAVLDQSTMNSWQGLFEVKGERNGSNQHNRGEQRVRSALEALDRANAADSRAGAP